MSGPYFVSWSGSDSLDPPRDILRKESIEQVS